MTGQLIICLPPIFFASPPAKVPPRAKKMRKQAQAHTTHHTGKLADFCLIWDDECHREVNMRFYLTLKTGSTWRAFPVTKNRTRARHAGIQNSLSKQAALPVAGARMHNRENFCHVGKDCQCNHGFIVIGPAPRLHSLSQKSPCGRCEARLRPDCPAVPLLPYHSR